jgi:hypothetical protein
MKGPRITARDREFLAVILLSWQRPQESVFRWRSTDRRLKRRLARKPVKLGLRARPDLADVGAHDGVERTT